MQAWAHLERRGKRAVLVWHRRAGKDSLCANFLCWQAHKRVGNYWHMLPTAKQGRKVVWEAIDKGGRRIIDQVFPPEIRVPGPRGCNEQEMLIRLRCGSTYQVLGSDNYDSNIGANPVGIVFSEYSVAHPAAWDYTRPILAENGGLALFAYTPRGMNHGYELFRLAQNEPGWFSQLLNVDQTEAIPPEVLEQERREFIALHGDAAGEALFNQEYYCSFDAAVPGSYYGKQLAEAASEGRTGLELTYDPSLELHTAWDVGIGDDTAIWFFQVPKWGQPRILHYLEGHGMGLEDWGRELERLAEERKWRYTCHWMPHDMDQRDLSTGKKRWRYAEELGIRPIKIVKKLHVDHGIQLVRQIIPTCYFSKEVDRALDTLRQYHSEYDEKRRTFQIKPVHDWTSHCADAFRYLATAIVHHMGQQPLGAAVPVGRTTAARVDQMEPKRWKTATTSPRVTTSPSVRRVLRGR